MTYTVTDITELIRHHLVFGADSESQADSNLRQLTGRIASMSTTPLWREAQWLFCNRCGTSVDTELINEDGAGYNSEGAFLCSTCRWPDDE
jgi:hypothetical protein